MEQLKQSEEEIIKLGKKIVSELELDSSNDTLSRWMAHYLSELIYNAENEESIKVKKRLEKECCEVIIKLWKNRDHVPRISQPLSNLKTVINLLDSLKEKKFTLPDSRLFDIIPKNNSWEKFVKTIKTSSDAILRLCILALTNKTILSKENEWVKNFNEMLTEDKKNVIERLSSFYNINVQLISSENNQDPIDALSDEDRYKLIFNKITDLITNQKEQLDLLKDNVLKSIKI